MQEFKLYMILLGAKPAGRHTEQHDVFFGIGTSLKDCLPDMFAFWPEAKKKLHIDAWRDVQRVNGYKVQVMPRSEDNIEGQFVKLFFINLGGYKPAEFEEFHYKMIIAAVNKDAAIAQAKTAFFRHCDSPHVDDKYGVDVDDIYEITDILPFSIKNSYSLLISPAEDIIEDELHLGYVRIEQLE